MKKTEKLTKSPIEQGCEEILAEFRNGAAEIAETDMDVNTRAKITLSMTQRYLMQLKRLVGENPFQDQPEEIWFFKYVKTELTAHLIYEQQAAQIIGNIPQGSMDTKLRYFEEEMRWLKKELGKNKYYYEYYRLNLNEIDNLGFVRGGEIPFPVLTEVEVPGSDFSTPLDYLFAKFRAFEDLLILMEILITELIRPIDIQTDLKTIENKGLKWTGDAINLVELAYAIWLTGQVNNGNANISEIMRWMEDNFQIKIGRAHRRWEEIAQRKRVSTTKYLDACREAIYKRIDDENGMK